MNRLFGHRPDPPGLPRHEGVHVGAVLEGTAAPPREVDNREWVLKGPGIGSQLTRACVLYTKLGALEATLAARGTPIPRKSRAYSYKVARLLERRAAYPDDPIESLPAITDTGSVPSFAVLGIQTKGCAPIEDDADDPATVNDDPGLIEREHALDFRIEGFSRIDATGDECTLQLQLAIASKFFPDGAMQADQALNDYTGGVYVPGGKVLGGHMVYLVGYRTLANGDVEFCFANHWTEGWGEGGFAWIRARDVVRWSDKYVLNPRRVS